MAGTPHVHSGPAPVPVDIADDVAGYRIRSAKAYHTARLCLMDTLSCGLEALSYPTRTNLMGPIVPGTIVPHGAKVPDTAFQLDPATRSIANAVRVRFKDGTKTENIVVEYPDGHRRRRAEGIPLLEAKFRTNLARRFAEMQRQGIFELCRDQKRLESTPVQEFVDRFTI